MAKKPTVSIVTITQLKRFKCLEILHDLIKDQSYDNIIDWVIVEGSKTEEMAKENANNVRGLIAASDMKINFNYIERTDGCKLGELRNRGNNACIGDITVAMDDDDYYPVDRVKHAVEMLSKSKYLIAGVSGMYIYDYLLKKLYIFKNFGPNHSVNSAMAWKKEYLKDNKHDPDKDIGEEPSFTKEWTRPMVQLDPATSIIQSSHTANTYNKRELLVTGTHKLNPGLDEVSKPITDFIKEPYLTRMTDLFYKEYESPYDIVYMAGGFSIKWDPADKSLGGSEQAIVNLASCWASMGKKVAVYGEIPQKKIDGVDYFHWKEFPFEARYKTVILWRGYGLMCTAPFPLKAKHIWLDLHDGVIQKQFIEAWIRYGSVVTKVLFRSEFHKEQFEKGMRKPLPSSRYSIIPNGIRVKDFSVNRDNVQRNPFRFCYCSCYTRGLVQILEFLWPIIYINEPRAELHVYYGMDNIQEEQFKNGMRMLLSQPGVMDHGRQPMEMIIREKYLSSFHLYLSNSPCEVDCISIRESLITGAIPLISNYGVFKHRDGVHFDVEETSQHSYVQNAVKILDFMKNPNLNMFREQLKGSQMIIPWKKIANDWLELMN